MDKPTFTDGGLGCIMPSNAAVEKTWPTDLRICTPSVSMSRIACSSSSLTRATSMELHVGHSWRSTCTANDSRDRSRLTCEALERESGLITPRSSLAVGTSWKVKSPYFATASQVMPYKSRSR